MKKKQKTSNIAKYYLLTSVLLIFFTHLVAIGYSNPSPVFNGMYIRYIHSDSYHIGETQDAKIVFSAVTNENCHVSWILGEGTLGLAQGEDGSWDEDLNTRIVSNTVLPGPSPGSHTWTRILTTASLNDIIPIFVYSSGDHYFNITLELNWTLPGNIKVEVWQLEDSDGSVVWYEKSTGIFLNGSFYTPGFWKKAEFVSTNVFGTSTTPGYEYFIVFTLLSVSIICGSVLIKYKRNRI